MVGYNFDHKSNIKEHVWLSGAFQVNILKLSVSTVSGTLGRASGSS